MASALTLVSRMARDTSQLTTGGSVTRIGNYLLVGGIIDLPTARGKIAVVDVSDPAAPVWTGSSVLLGAFSNSAVRHIHVVGTKGYAIQYGGIGFVYVLDLSALPAITVLGSWQQTISGQPRPTRALAKLGNYLLMDHARGTSSLSDGLSMLDVTTDTPAVLGAVPAGTWIGTYGGEFTIDAACYFKDRYAAACKRDAFTNGRLEIWDTQGAPGTAPTVVGFIESSSLDWPFTVEWDGGDQLLVWSRSGWSKINVANPAAPAIVGTSPNGDTPLVNALGTHTIRRSTWNPKLMAATWRTNTNPYVSLWELTAAAAPVERTRTVISLAFSDYDMASTFEGDYVYTVSALGRPAVWHASEIDPPVIGRLAVA